MPGLDRVGRRLVLCAAVFGSVSFGGFSCAAAPLKLPDTPYHYTVIDQDLTAALQEFGANLNVKVSVSQDVKGRVQGSIPEGTAQAFLDRIAAIYNLDWYYDGNVLYVTSAKENRTQLVVLSPVGYDAFEGALQALQISDSRFPLHTTANRGVVMISGPPRYVALAEQTLAGLLAEEQARPKLTLPVPAATHPPPPRSPVLAVFRGSGATFIRDGRPE